MKKSFASFHTLPTSFVEGAQEKMVGDITIVSSNQRSHSIHMVVGSENVLGQVTLNGDCALHTGSGAKPANRLLAVKVPVPENYMSSMRVWVIAITPSAITWQKFSLFLNHKGRVEMKEDGPPSTESPAILFMPDHVRKALDWLGIPHGTKPVQTELYKLLPAGSFFAWADLIHRCRKETREWCYRNGMSRAFKVADEAMNRLYVASGFTLARTKEGAVIRGDWMTFQEHMADQGTELTDYIIGAWLASDLRKVGLLPVSADWDDEIIANEYRYGGVKRDDAMALLTGMRGLVVPSSVKVEARNKATAEPEIVEDEMPELDAGNIHAGFEEDTMPVTTGEHVDAEEQAAAFKEMMEVASEE